MKILDCRIILPALLVALSSPIDAEQAAQVDMAAATREYEVVPCLLPARVRKLGKLTYPERRRLVEVSARNCRLKGGEFTFYDRAKPESAVAFFSKLAETGNVDAQVSLGDVYQYLFVQPNYEKAAYWYQIASDAGSKKGMMQIARLYERGLGVVADPLMATNLWREATGAGEELVLASTLEASQTRAAARIGQLTDQLRQRNEEAEAVRYELSVARAEVAERKDSLADAESELADIRTRMNKIATTSQDTRELNTLKNQLTAQQLTIDDQRFQIGSLEDNLGVREAQLTANLRQVERQNQRLTQELGKVTEAADETLQVALAEVETKDDELNTLNQQLATARNALQNTDSAYADLSTLLEQARTDAADNRRSRKQISALETEKEQQRAQMDSQRQRISRLEVDLARVSGEAETLHSDLDDQIDATAVAQAQYAQTDAELQQVQVRMTGLQNQLVDAQAQLTRTTEERSALQGQVASTTEGNDKIKKLEIQLGRQNTQQQAQIDDLVDQVEKYAAELTEIRLRRSAIAMRTPMLDTSTIRLPRDVKIGNYHALIIGNNNYTYLTDLVNAQSDARAMHELLKAEYGFNSTLLLDATQEETFSAFQQISADTKENDLVLIYYAGHGYRTQNESYWLPIEVPSRASADIRGVSSLKVADWVRAMPAKHVMIVADSCYSGSGIETSGGYRYDLETLEASLPFFMKSKSRTMLTSGNVAPVMDGGGNGQHSIFTEALLGLLSENQGVLHAGALHDYLVERVKYSAQGTRVNQTPQFGSIESAGHENGQFVFLHRNVRS